MCAHVCMLILKKVKRFLSKCFHVSPAHLALVTASVTCVWLGSVPAPIAPLWESRITTEWCWALTAAVPRTPGNMGGSPLCFRQEIASHWPGCYLSFHLCLLIKFFFFLKPSPEVLLEMDFCYFSPLENNIILRHHLWDHFDQIVFFLITVLKKTKHYEGLGNIVQLYRWQQSSVRHH